MPIGVVPPSSGLAGDLSGVNDTASVPGTMPSWGWVHPRIEHTESTESSYFGIPDEILVVAEGHAGTETLGALSPKIPIQGQRMVPASWSIIGLNPWFVKDARRYTRAIAGLWGEILPQARAAGNPIRTRSRSGLRCGYRSRTCEKMRLSRHRAAAVEEGGMLTHKHTRVPVRLPELSNR